MKFRFKAIGLTVVATAVLTACGGGSSSSSNNTDNLTLSGTAATGLTLAGGTVNVICANNTSIPTTATTTVNADGQYSISVPNAVLPCMLQATGKDKDGNPITMYSFTSSSNTVNVTPLTDAVVTQALSSSNTTPAAMYSNTGFTQTSATTLADNLPGATSTVVASAQVLAGSTATVPTTPVAIFNTPFTPATTMSATNSDPMDSAIDAVIAAALAAAGTNATFKPTVQIALASFNTVIATNGTTTPTAATLRTAISTAAPQAAATIASAAAASYASKLSADQAVFESIGLTEPGGAYKYSWFAPRSGAPTSSTYLYSSNEQLAISPFTGGPQTVHYLPGVSLFKTIPVPASGGRNTRYIVNGSIVVPANPVQMIVSYPSGSTGVQIDELASDGKTLLSSTLRSNYQKSSLTGAVVSTPITNAFYNTLSAFFTNTSFLSSSAMWQPGMVSVSFTNTNMKDKYVVFDSNCVPSAPVTGPTESGIRTWQCSTYTTTTTPIPVASNTTIAALMANGGSISITASNSAGTAPVTTAYTSSMGTTNSINGVNTYVATSQIESGTGVYRTFYELNGNVYVGTYVPANLVQNQSVWTNGAARNSFADAQNF